MDQSQNKPRGEEFVIDTNGKKPLSPRQAVLQCEELLSLRGRLESLERQAFEYEVRQEESQRAAHRRWLKTLQTAVAIVDELRRLVDDTRRNLPTASPRPAPAAWRLRFRRKPAPEKPADDLANTWLEAIARHSAAAIQRLYDHDVFNIELLGEDLRELEFEGHDVQRWVGVKNRPTTEGKLVVRKEIQGLWVGRIEGQLVPIQRGEVVV
jgi:hypothetical protein